MQLAWLAVAWIPLSLQATAAETVTIESRKADGKPNTPQWQEVSGKWNTSKNKSRVADNTSSVATNVSVSFTNNPPPAFKVQPLLDPNKPYKVEVTFGTSSTYGASTDLEVAITAEGVASSTLTNTGAFKAAGANAWNLVGLVIPSTNQPSLTFTYKSGILSRESRWYTDAVRFTPIKATNSAPSQ